MTSQPTALESALAQLDAASATMETPIWEDHAAAVPAAVEALSKFYLFVDADTGKTETGPDGLLKPIFTDPNRRIFALYPSTVEPLINLLIKQTEQLQTLQTVPDSSQIAIKRWAQRLDYYKRILAEEKLLGASRPSERLFNEVMRPLLLGRYSKVFAQMGIVNPDVRSKPDVVTPATELFVVALDHHLVSDSARWLLDAGIAIDEWRAELRTAVKSLLDPVADAGKKALWVVGTALGLGTLIYLAYTRSKTSQLSIEKSSNGPRI